MVRTLCSKEIEVKKQLEKVLRQCVDDVKGEIAKKRSENKSIYRKSFHISDFFLYRQGKRWKSA